MIRSKLKLGVVCGFMASLMLAGTAKADERVVRLFDVKAEAVGYNYKGAMDVVYESTSSEIVKVRYTDDTPTDYTIEQIRNGVVMGRMNGKPVIFAKGPDFTGKHAGVVHAAFARRIKKGDFRQLDVVVTPFAKEADQMGYRTEVNTQAGRLEADHLDLDIKLIPMGVDKIHFYKNSKRVGTVDTENLPQVPSPELFQPEYFFHN